MEVMRPNSRLDLCMTMQPVLSLGMSIRTAAARLCMMALSQNQAVRV